MGDTKVVLVGKKRVEWGVICCLWWGGGVGEGNDGVFVVGEGRMRHCGGGGGTDEGLWAWERDRRGTVGVEEGRMRA